MYIKSVKSGAFKFKFGNMGYAFGSSLGIFIDFNDPIIKEAIETQSFEFISAVKDVFSIKDILDARYTMDVFEHYYLQGHGWNFINSYEFKALHEFKMKAQLVLNCEHSSAYQIEIANKILNSLNGDYYRETETPKTPQQIAKAQFQRKKNKLRLKLTIRDGYKCDNCKIDTTDNLCIIQKTKDDFNYEVDNLTFRCRKCLNKLRNKKSN